MNTHMPLQVDVTYRLVRFQLFSVRKKYFAEPVEHQAEILDAPRSWDYGHRTLFFRDPEGNVLEIYADI